ncbi:MAG: chorismate mutase [bacterium]
MDIEDWRSKIDAIDDQILLLLNTRAGCCIAIGQLKETREMPVYSPIREKRIIERMVTNNSGPFSADGVRRVFERIIDESRKLEKDELTK